MEVSALRQTSLPGLPGSVRLLRLQSDERLIALVRRGHHAAFEALVARYQSRLLAFCRHMLGSKEDAEDVLQEVFTAAFNAILADEREIDVRPWLYRIARNRSLNHLRRASPVGVDSMDVYYAENGQSTGEKILRRESFRQLISDVQHLPETQRTALLLREIEALSYDQIADTMETTVPSVKSLLVRARISLAEAAEARKLSCEDVRLELGEVAEGLVKISAPARRHVRECERCRAFKKHLKDNNHALAMIMPVAPLLLVKKVLLAKLGSTASAGHVAAGGGATAGAAAGATAGGTAGGLAGLGATAIATKAVAGLAAAAIVTAGAVEAGHTSRSHHSHHSTAVASTSTVADLQPQSTPVVIRSQPQPTTPVRPMPIARVTRHQTNRTHHPALTHHKPASVTAPPVTSAPQTSTVVAQTPDAVKPPTSKPDVTQVTAETTELPSSTSPSPPPPASAAPTVATSEPQPTTTTTPPATTTTATTPETTPPPERQSTTESAETQPPGNGESGSGAAGALNP